MTRFVILRHTVGMLPDFQKEYVSHMLKEQGLVDSVLFKAVAWDEPRIEVGDLSPDVDQEAVLAAVGSSLEEEICDD